MRTWSIIPVLAALVCLTSLTPASAIEAIKGKEYHLTERHGPWMIMVASFRDVPKDRREPGLNAQEAAQELVYELRKKGIPAYTHAQGGIIERIETIDRLGREDERIYAAQRDMICVIAGNYPSIDDETAQKTLKWIKNFRPEFMQRDDSGAIYRETPGRRGPLGGAFLTVNPLLDSQQLVRKKPSRDMVRLNSSSAFPLLSCKKSYTVQVATFTGRQTTPMAGSKYEGKEDLFDRELNNPNSYNLNRAGEDAEQLVNVLRSKGVEAYVHHEVFQSIVTVGGFDSPHDPGIAAVQREYAPKYKTVEEGSGKDKRTREVLSPEWVAIPNKSDPKNLPPHIWVFDLTPQTIEVPRLR